MSRGLTAEQRQYAQEVFQQLLERFKNQKDVADRLDVDQTRVSKGRATGEVSMQVLIAAAALAGRSMEEVTRRTGMKLRGSVEPSMPSDPLIGTFMMKLGELPGLKNWVIPGQFVARNASSAI